MIVGYAFRRMGFCLGHAHLYGEVEPGTLFTFIFPHHLS